MQVLATGRNLGLEVVTQEARNAEDINRAVDALAAQHVEAINVLAAASFWAARVAILDRMRDLGLPAIYFWRWFTEQGGLISFAPAQDEGDRLLARQLIRVLNGAEPAKLPILQPTKFELVINFKTAKSLGLAIPPSLLARADEVIE